MKARKSVLVFGIGVIAFAELAASPVAAQQELQARGVNPAENSTRADVIPKYNWLANGAGIFTTTLKYDQRLTQEWGFNVEMPVLGNFYLPGVPGADDTGIGDLFARIRYIKTLGQLSLGGAVETVLPTATRATLGGGTWQMNVSALAVYAWTPSLITAVVGKAAQSVDELNGRTRVQENTVRAIQAFILPQGRFITLDVKYNWETVNLQDKWWEAQAEAGMMLDAQTALSVAYSRKFGDRADRGAVAVTGKRFF